MNQQQDIGQVREISTQFGHSVNINMNVASKYEVSMQLNLTSKSIDVKYKWTTQCKKVQQLSQSLLQEKPSQIEGMSVHGFTRFTLNQTTFRADPCYKNEGAWFDWVLIAWTIPDGTSQATMENANYPDFVELSTSKSSSNPSKAMLVPTKLITFIEDQHGEQFAIVHSCCQY